MPTFLHSGDLGDIIYFLPSIRDLGGGTLYLCTREFTKEMTPARFEAIRALALAQPYVTACEIHKGQQVKYDVTEFRKTYHRTNGANLATVQAHYLNTTFVPDLHKPWLTCEPIRHGRPVFARSPRYNTDEWTKKIWPRVMQEHPNAIFVGLPEEHKAFERAFGRVEFAPTDNLLHTARLIAGSPIFIGNQSSPYAVCEGLKHHSIQETDPHVPDVIFRRPNAAYVSTLSEYQALPGNNGKFALCLQFHDGDAEQAIKLARWMSDNEGQPRDDIEMVLSVRFDTDPKLVVAAADALGDSFPNVFVVRSDRRGKGYPQGCNEQWASTMTQVCHWRRTGHIKSDGIFTFEPDCLPCREDWIDRIKQAWDGAKARGKLFSGHLCRDEQGKPTHVNGNMILPTDINRTHASLVAGSSGVVAWDVHHRAYILKHGEDTTAIHQTKRIDEFTEEMFTAVEKAGDRPAIWHGIKDTTALDHLTQWLAACP